MTLTIAQLRGLVDDHSQTGGIYYESNPMVEARMPQTPITFEFDDDGEIPAKNGAPMRLRTEISTGFRNLEWHERIEVVNRYAVIGEGRGG